MASDALINQEGFESKVRPQHVVQNSIEYVFNDAAVDITQRCGLVANRSQSAQNPRVMLSVGKEFRVLRLLHFDFFVAEMRAHFLPDPAEVLVEFRDRHPVAVAEGGKTFVQNLDERAVLRVDILVSQQARLWQRERPAR